MKSEKRKRKEKKNRKKKEKDEFGSRKKNVSLSTTLSYSIVSYWTEMTLESAHFLTLYSNKQKTCSVPFQK